MYNKYNELLRYSNVAVYTLNSFVGISRDSLTNRNLHKLCYGINLVV